MVVQPFIWYAGKAVRIPVTRHISVLDISGFQTKVSRPRNSVI